VHESLSLLPRALFTYLPMTFSLQPYPASTLARCLPRAFFYFLAVASCSVPGTRRDRPDATDAVRRASHAADRAC